MNSAKPVNKASLAIGNTIAEMTRVVEFVDRFGAANGIPKAIVNNLNLCLDELLNNTISYGYDDREPHSIVVDLSVADGLLIVEIKDDAKPFDPRRPTPAAFGDTLRARKVGGLGLQFVKTLMDDMDYRRVERTNIVKITKRLREDAHDGDR
jgi:anti-sigma regulatory factor (Ser/Thr protein kinase)